MELDNIVVTRIIIGRIWEGLFLMGGVIILRLEEIKIK